MRLTADWLQSAPSQTVCRMLTDAGYQAYFVGGCVRNDLLDAPVADLDISTDAPPEQTLSLAQKAGLKAVPTGIDHGTITVLADGIPYEITTFRRDVETFGRHAVVAFAETMDEDAHRRDFTMNALYADSTGKVFDPVNGLPDLRARRIRFIGEAADRIKEDYLRILRFFRFTAWYGDPEQGIDADGLAACGEHIDGLAQLSAERVGAEMRKLLSAPDPAPAVASMASCGALGAVLPGAVSGVLTVLVHLEDGMQPDAMRRLAAIGGEDAADRFRLSNVERRKLDAIQAGLETDIAELGYKFKDTALDSYLVRQASLSQPLDEKEVALINHARVQEFPVKASDLMPQFEGSELGAKLRELEARWIASGYSLTREDLCAENP